MSVYGMGSKSFGPYTVLAWTAQSVNFILPENICFICYVIPNQWIKKTVIVLLHQHITSLTSN